MAMIEIVDRFLSKEEFDSVLRYCYESAYSCGEVDYEGAIPTGMIRNISDSEFLYEMLVKKTQKLVPDLGLNRIYVNCFAPSENPYFHIDGKDGVTFLYYANPVWELDEGGETQFFIDSEIRGVTPIPNRLVYFDSNIPHRATTFRTRHRFTIALKYGL